MTRAAVGSARVSAGGAFGALDAKLARLGIRRRFDLILHLPLRYEDETRITRIADCRPGEACQVEAEIFHADVQYRPRRQLLLRVRDASGELALRFFAFYPSQLKQLGIGAKLRLFGEVRGGFWGAEMVHPRYRVVAPDEPLPDRLTPIYPTTAGLAQAALRRLVQQALGELPLDDTVPEPIRDALRLPAFADAVRLLHNPPPQLSGRQFGERTDAAWRRVKFDELLAQQLSLRHAYAVRRSRAAPALVSHGTLTRRLIERLPFRLTRAQVRVWSEISRDLAQPHPMQRLLQGDVGSGKTVIAALAMLQAAENGLQAALMAPTEILAEQHYRKLKGWVDPLGVAVLGLTGGLRKTEKEPLLAALREGRCLLAVGTHALIEEAVCFERLALAIVDEQHRFGVRQRLALRKKGSGPHQLMMSATPIPRTLAMSHYADLDVSVLDELPPGRTPVLTKLASDARRDEVIGRIRAACRQGRQAYWVCPVIEESETLELQAALDTHARLAAELPELRVGLAHGRLSAEDKFQVMNDFAAGRINLLVATTVIEVGVDVANASLMVVEHAERFGLAQLHQLRGRIGRGARESVCILMYQSPLSDAARARLRIVYENQDGFEIARQDLLLRGPGEFLGARQSGVPLLRFADLARDEDLVGAARAAAERMLRDHPEAARRHLERWLAEKADFASS